MIDGLKFQVTSEEVITYYRGRATSARQEGEKLLVGLAEITDEGRRFETKGRAQELVNVANVYDWKAAHVPKGETILIGSTTADEMGGFEGGLFRRAY